MPKFGILFDINGREISGKHEQRDEFSNKLRKCAHNPAHNVNNGFTKEVFNSEYEMEFTVHGDSYDPSSNKPQLQD